MKFRVVIEIDVDLANITGAAKDMPPAACRGIAGGWANGKRC